MSQWRNTKLPEQEAPTTARRGRDATLSQADRRRHALFALARHFASRLGAQKSALDQGDECRKWNAYFGFTFILVFC